MKSTKKTTRRKKPKQDTQDRARVETLSDCEKHRLQAEALTLLVKLEECKATDAEKERLRDLISCGMLPGDNQAPQGVQRDRVPMLKELAKTQFDAVAGGAVKREEPLPGLFYNNEAEALFVQAERGRLTGNAFADRANDIERERERLEGILTAVEQGHNIFAPMGKLWVVSYNGKREFVPPRAGMPYLSEILKRAASETGNDGGLTPEDLCNATHAPPPDMLINEKPLADKVEADIDEDGDPEPQRVTPADRNAIDYQDAQEECGYSKTSAKGMTPEEHKFAVNETKKRLSDATEEGDEEAAKVARRLLRRLGAGDPKRKRRPPEPVKEKSRVRVANAIRRALKDIEKVHPAAAKVLRAVKTENGRYTYNGPKFTT